MTKEQQSCMIPVAVMTAACLKNSFIKLPLDLKSDDGKKIVAAMMLPTETFVETAEHPLPFQTEELQDIMTTTDFHKKREYSTIQNKIYGNYSLTIRQANYPYKRCVNLKCISAGKNRCTRCGVGYCGKECQQQDWSRHKKICKKKA
jgi:hypothetical protein